MARYLNFPVWLLCLPKDYQYLQICKIQLYKHKLYEEELCGETLSYYCLTIYLANTQTTTGGNQITP